MEDHLNYNSLIIKFLSKEIEDSELIELKSWLEKDPANCRLFDKENELWHNSSIRTNCDHFNTDNAWADISKNLGMAENRSKNIKVFQRTSVRIMMAAASILLLLTIGASLNLLFNIKTEENPAITITRVQTDAGEKARIFLNDSTFVILNAGSTLEYTSAYNVDDRLVRLNGEAYFEVRTNSMKPFIVRTSGLNICAVGTKFNVYSYETEDRMETTLEEGNIQVFLNDGEREDIKPGQQIVYFPKSNKAIIRDVSTETYTSWKDNKLHFIDVPFEELLRQISRHYNVVFEVRGKNLLNLRYTATFIDESIEEVMEMLKEVSPIKYKIIKRTTADDEKYLKPKIIVEKVKI